MSLLKRIQIRSYEVGLQFQDGEFLGLLGPGTHWVFDPFRRKSVDVVSRRAPRLLHEKLDLIAASGVLKSEATVVDLKDDRRALVWIDGRFATVLGPGLHAFWNGSKEVRVELVNAGKVRFEHEDLKVIARASGSNMLLDVCNVKRDGAGVVYIDGRYVETVGPGLHAFWRGASDATVVEVDLRETTLEVGGQDIMTADKVTLRVNALVTYRVIDPRRAVSTTEDLKQSLYREAQLAIRAVVGARELDVLLNEKDTIASEVAEILRRRQEELGVEILTTGLRDVILPGDMKELMNKVIEARKAAEANLVTRREETAALRSQANTAKLLADNPVLMRLRELEVLEKVAGGGKLNVVLGEKGLADRIVNLI